jgi:hypothetical protein
MKRSRAEQIMAWIDQHARIRTHLDLTGWIALKLSCSRQEAERAIEAARAKIAQNTGK